MNIYQKLSRTHTLLIDDDEWIRNAMCIVFESEGCSLTAVETAEEALRALREREYGVIICDYKLPGMDGLQFFRRISAEAPDTARLLITAYGSEELHSQAADIGIDDVIEKPFTAQVIEDSLKRIFSRTRPARKPDSGKGENLPIE